MMSSVLGRAAARPVPAAAALALLACADASAPTSARAPAPAAESHAPAPPVVSVFSSGFLYPRGLAFGPDGTLYVAEGGSGGATSTSGQCTQVVPPVGPYTNGPTARISKVDRQGNRTTFASGFPSAIAAIGDVDGVGAVAFQGGKLYALVSGGGCSHGSAGVPAGVARVDLDGSWAIVANLSAYQAANPVAQPFAGDYEPDGTWYSMIRSRDGLVAVEPNHGELASIDPRTGDVKRILDISASQGHIVPTTVVEHEGAYYVGNLGGFPSVPGSQKVLRITRGGDVSVVATGFTAILGLEFDRGGRMYVLETTTAAGFPTPNTGRIVRVERNGARRTIAEHLFFPTAMRFGPDHALYVSSVGFGPPLPGDILRIGMPD